MADLNIARVRLRECYHAGIAVVSGRHCVMDFLRDQPLDGDVYLIAIGKAAEAMAQGACEVLADQVRAGLVITKQTQGQLEFPNIHFMQAGHPLPDERSLQAGQSLLAFIAGLPKQAQVLFLLSGGASALVEVLPEHVDAQQLTAINQWLLGSGLAIAEMNAVRKRVSCIKGGRLARHMTGHLVTCLAISDVQHDDPRVIGSGLLVPDPALQQPLNVTVPPWIAHIIDSAPAAPDVSDTCFTQITFHIVATLSHAKQAAALMARSRGYKATLHETFISGDALVIGERLARQLIEGGAGVHIWGGETTIKLPVHPGRGGRNQSLALSAARVLQGRDNILLLAAGTDGNDGSGEDAGAIVDGGTVSRGEKVLGRRAVDCLAQADAGTLLAASGDLLRTGPTGTNVMDLIIGLKYS